MLSKMIKAIIFDMDGLLIDNEPLHYEAWRRVYEKYHLILTEEDFIPFVGKGNKFLAEDISKKLQDPVNLNSLIDKKNKEYNLLMQDIKAVDGALPLIRLLKKSFRVSVASSTTRKDVYPILKRIGLFNEFEIIITGNEVKNIKPAPDIYLLAAERLKLNPQECVALEDSLYGVLSAKNAGMKCIAVPHKFSKHQDLSRANLIVNNLKEINIKTIKKDVEK